MAKIQITSVGNDGISAIYFSMVNNFSLCFINWTWKDVGIDNNDFDNIKDSSHTTDVDIGKPRYLKFAGRINYKIFRGDIDL